MSEETEPMCVCTCSCPVVLTGLARTVFLDIGLLKLMRMAMLRVHLAPDNLGAAVSVRLANITKSYGHGIGSIITCVGGNPGSLEAELHDIRAQKTYIPTCDHPEKIN